ncbi:hypothetical protein BJY52DRAFT_1419488 [Lactarius psammicola]|nr:hypothetical protein BJY52DRAFT_1419488 [Lactarius psammicola]
METAPLEASEPQCHPNADGPPELLLLDDPDADIILRSCDLQEFRVLKIYLIKISPVLSELIQFPHTGRAGTLPCIQLSDSGTILSSLLSFVLPVPFVLPPTPEKIMELLSVAQKYKMNSTLAHIRAAVGSQDPPFIRPETAFHIYTLAQRYGLGQEVAQAARMALTFEMTIEGLEDKFDTMPGVYFHSLWRYYQRVRTNLSSDLIAFRTHEAHSTLAGQNCQIGISSGIPTWVDSYIASIGDNPAFFSLSEFHIHLTRHLLYSGCLWCRNLSIRTMDVCWKALTVVVNNSMIKSEQDLLLTEEETRLRSHPDLNGSASPGPRDNYFTLEPPHADIIIQSSDLVSFRVNKATLSMSSPFFADMFSLPQPPDNEVINGLPVVRLSEDAEVLNSLLKMLYPISSAVPDSYDKALELLVASHKYNMASVQSSIRTEIKSWGPVVLTGTVAYRAYAISSSAKLLPEMTTSARHTLDFPMTLEYLSDELSLFEGWALRDLVRYRKRCRDGLVSTLQSFLDSNTAPSNIWVVCVNDPLNSYPYNKREVFPRWLQDIFSQRTQKLQETFTNPLLKPSSIREAYLAALNTHISSHDCLPCMKVHTLKGETFCEELERKLEQALDKVRRIPDSRGKSSLTEPISRNVWCQPSDK